MVCETEYNALKSEQTDNLRVCKKYQILKMTVVDEQYFIPIQFSCSSQQYSRENALVILQFFFCCQMREMCGVIFSMSHAFSGLSGCL